MEMSLFLIREVNIGVGQGLFQARIILPDLRAHEQPKYGLRWGAQRHTALDQPQDLAGQSRDRHLSQHPDPFRPPPSTPNPKRCRRSCLTLPPHSIQVPPMSSLCMDCGGKHSATPLCITPRARWPNPTICSINKYSKDRSSPYPSIHSRVLLTNWRTSGTELISRSRSIRLVNRWIDAILRDCTASPTCHPL
jgi:hypothetical protein